MNNKITSIAAALVAKAGTNASAGIGANLSDKQESTRKRITSCTTNSSNSLTAKNSESDQIEATNSCKHQIGTNLSELSVCWHKMTWPDNCNRCGEPFYRVNQFECEKCDSEDDLVAGALRNEFFDKSLDIKGGLSSNPTLSSSTLSSLFLNIAPISDCQPLKEEKNLNEDLAGVEYLTRKNFEDEFSSMIINSTCGGSNKVLSSEFDSMPNHDITKSITAVPSILTDK